MITVMDEDCVDSFRAILNEPDYRVEWNKINVSDKKQSDLAAKPLSTPTPKMLKEWKEKGLLPILGDSLSQSDYDLLEEYIPKLFNTIPDPAKNLDAAIFNLIVLIKSYRYVVMERGWFEDQFDTYAKTKDKKGKDEKIESIKNNIKQIIQLLGNKTPNGAVISPKARSEIIPTLENLYRNPDEYLLDNPKYTISKKPISDYLHSLKLPYKSNVIKEFMKKI